MKYIKIDDDTFVEYDKVTRESNIIFKSAIESELAVTNAQLSALPATPSNAELLAWAKTNFTDSYVRAREVLEATVKSLDNKLTKINALP